MSLWPRIKYFLCVFCPSPPLRKVVLSMAHLEMMAGPSFSRTASLWAMSISPSQTIDNEYWYVASLAATSSYATSHDGHFHPSPAKHNINCLANAHREASKRGTEWSPRYICKLHFNHQLIYWKNITRYKLFTPTNLACSAVQGTSSGTSLTPYSLAHRDPSGRWPSPLHLCAYHNSRRWSWVWPRTLRNTTSPFQKLGVLEGQCTGGERTRPSYRQNCYIRPWTVPRPLCAL